MLLFKTLETITDFDAILEAMPKGFEVNELNWKHVFIVCPGDPTRKGLKMEVFNGKILGLFRTIDDPTDK